MRNVLNTISAVTVVSAFHEFHAILGSGEQWNSEPT